MTGNKARLGGCAACSGEEKNGLYISVDRRSNGLVTLTL